MTAWFLATSPLPPHRSPGKERMVVNVINVVNVVNMVLMVILHLTLALRRVGPLSHQPEGDVLNLL